VTSLIGGRSTRRDKKKKAEYHPQGDREQEKAAVTLEKKNTKEYSIPVRAG